MGTKQDGDPCYDGAMPDEPMFVLLARDPSAPKFVRAWALGRIAEIAAGTRPSDDIDQANEALATVDKMRDWRFANITNGRKTWQNASRLTSARAGLLAAAKAYSDACDYNAVCFDAQSEDMEANRAADTLLAEAIALRKMIEGITAKD